MKGAKPSWTGILNKKLNRYPYRKDDLLQAWDAADELILKNLADPGKTLIINDSFGALCANVNAPVAYTDSFVSARGTELNAGILPLHRLQDIHGQFDTVLIRIPKNMSFFEDILCHLSTHIHSQSRIICGVMVKHQSPSAFDLLNKYIGETWTGLAEKKARLIFAKVQKSAVDSPWPRQVSLEGDLFLHHSNLFSREKLDIGTRFFLEHIPKGRFETIIDLGCANGIIGIRAKELNPESKIVFTDDSAMAIESARSNYHKRFKDEAQFHWTNCLEGMPPGSADLVLCNPPFHQQNTVGDFIAHQMFSDAKRALKPGGVLRIIGNSHLGYHQKLKKLFGNYKIIASNDKFTVIEASSLGRSS